MAEGVSYGADPYRDGVTLTPRRELRSLALPSEIMRLPNLTGYIKLPGPYPVAHVRLKYVKRPKRASRFVPRDDAGEFDPRTDVPADDRGPERNAPTGPVAEPAVEPSEPALASDTGDRARVETGGPVRQRDEPGPEERSAPQQDGSRDVSEGENGPPADAEPGEVDGYRI